MGVHSRLGMRGGGDHEKRASHRQRAFSLLRLTSAGGSSHFLRNVLVTPAFINSPTERIGRWTSATANLTVIFCVRSLDGERNALLTLSVVAIED